MLSGDLFMDFRILKEGELEGKVCRSCGGGFSTRVVYEVGYEAKRNIDMIGVRKGQIYHEGCLARKISG